MICASYFLFKNEHVILSSWLSNWKDHIVGDVDVKVP